MPVVGLCWAFWQFLLPLHCLRFPSFEIQKQRTVIADMSEGKRGFAGGTSHFEAVGNDEIVQPGHGPGPC